MEHAHSTTPITAAMTRVCRGNSNIGASQKALMTKAWRNPLKPEVPVNWISSWVMPEKYQKNTNSQTNPAQSKPAAVVLLRLNKDIQRSSREFTTTAGTWISRTTNEGRAESGDLNE
ncbi:hypothetical protein D3C71_641850 [compost metagenome]